MVPDPICPACASTLRPGLSVWSCPGCDSRFPALRGIPDLRTADDLFRSNRDDWAFARELDSAFDRLDFRGLLDLYFDLEPEVPPGLRDRQIGHILTAPGRAGQWVEALGESGRIGPILDLGCGSGSFLAAPAARSLPAVGVDIALRWLVVARKRLDEDGLEAVRLVCACAERLPFRDAGFSGIVAGDSIEHVESAERTIAESHRVLRPGGLLVMATPNRFSLAPSPTSARGGSASCQGV